MAGTSVWVDRLVLTVCFAFFVTVGMAAASWYAYTKIQDAQIAIGQTELSKEEAKKAQEEAEIAKAEAEKAIKNAENAKRDAQDALNAKKLAENKANAALEKAQKAINDATEAEMKANTAREEANAARLATENEKKKAAAAQAEADKKLADAQKKLNDFLERIKVLEGGSADLANALEKVKNELKIKTEEAIRLAKNMSDKSDENDRLSQQLTDKNSESQRLQNKVQELEKRLKDNQDEFERRVAEALGQQPGDDNPSGDNIDSILKSIQKMLSEINDSAKKIARLENDLKTAENQRDAYKRDLNSAKSTLNNCKDAYRKYIAAMKAYVHWHKGPEDCDPKISGPDSFYIY